MRSALVALAIALLPLSATAADPAVNEAQRAQLERLRAEVADQIQLQAYDLLDELVYGWTRQPVFALPTPVVLADVSVPVGFGSGLEALVENHFASLVVKNPRSGVVLAHCPQCTAVVVHSGKKGTVVARGVDAPEALAAAGTLSGSKHALFLDFEAEGAALVLRARITSLEPALPIVYAKTLSTSTSSAALLRTGDRLKSADEARQEYLDALAGRGVFLVPLKIGVRTFASPPDGSQSPIGAPPMPWLLVGMEVGLTQARAWTGSLHAGLSWTPDVHTSWMAQARISRLLSGNTVSLTRPDLYGFLGASVTSVHGTGAQLFRYDVPTVEDLIAEIDGAEPLSRFAGFQFGLELRVKNRIGAAVFLETLPGLAGGDSIGNYLDFGFISFQSFGAEVSFCF